MSLMVSRFFFKDAVALMAANRVISGEEDIPFIIDHVRMCAVVASPMQSRVTLLLTEGGLSPESMSTGPADRDEEHIFASIDDDAGTEWDGDPDATYVAAWRTWV